MMDFAVAVFEDLHEVTTTPSNWISKDKRTAWWPPYASGDKLFLAVKRREKPDKSTWKKHKIHIIKYFGESVSI